MKLAFCLFNYFPFGGLQRDFIRIARECVRRNHSVDVYTMKWEGEKEPGLNIICLPVSARQNHTRCQQFVTQVQHKLIETKYDLVVGFNKMPGLDIYYAADTCFQAKARKKHGAWYRLTPRYRHLVSYENAVFAAPATTQILLIAAQQQTEFQHYYQTQSERFHLLPPGIARDRLATSDSHSIRKKLRAEWKINDNDLLLLMVGSGFKTKGLDRTLLSIAALNPDLKNRVKLFVIGKDNPARFIRQAKKLKINPQITFLGGRHDVPDFLLAADLLLHPAYNENTGTVLLEAVAAGLPVLTTDVCGYAHYITEADAGCVIASPFNQHHLNQTLASMLLSLKQSAWQQNALNFAKNADIYSMPERAADLIEKFGKFESQLDFDQIMSLQGEVYRQQEGRCTQKIVLDGKNYFIKQHHGVGWKEIFKNLLQLRPPVLSAKNEWRAIEKLHHLSIPTLNIAGYGARGFNPARLKSFLITEELPDHISLEHLCKDWKHQPPEFRLKQNIIKEVARIARTIHSNGINHRDFYICHFLLKIPHDKHRPKIYLIDLHRAMIWSHMPARWMIKDLAGLYFSSYEIGLTKRDILRFLKEYRNTNLKNILNKEFLFWQKVKKRGDKLFRKHTK